ncbi:MULTISPECIES: TetR/AcrR family transcriptional regulator [Gordonia]|uniref:TetR/AcrR family transcriptional regulator n=1 Tax=Gordonia TaxID=2053 RepID=UPI0007840ECB|nr:TetR/AcrR family transcriptional regulator [Gordonia sp. QH-12]KXT56008.1 TetR family transcriptional regulator [Gordonia sp. QH-12]
MTVPLTPPSDKRRRRTHDAVLDAAAELFADQGFRRTSVDQLAHAADVALSSIYSNFPGGKADVYVALACRIARDHVERMEAAIASAEEAVELAVFDEYLLFHADNPLAFRALGLVDVGPDDSELVDQARAMIRGLLGGLVEQVVGASALPPRAARLEALRLWGTANGMISLRAQGFTDSAEFDDLLASIRGELADRVDGAHRIGAR